jgi:hypothetical protein
MRIEDNGPGCGQVIGYLVLIAFFFPAFVWAVTVSIAGWISIFQCGQIICH